MLRTHTPVRALTPADRDEALALCARDPAANCFVAGRIEEGALHSMPGALLGVPGQEMCIRDSAGAGAPTVTVS